jgi:hypothetical protein
LFLFVAALLPLLLANRWAFTLAALMAGVGVGLFIDEVGKFITSGNDYFYPPAAPIIYVFFLLTVLVYLQIRRPPSKDPRAVFYRAFEDLQEVLDHDLDPEERAGLVAELRSVAADQSNPNLARLAIELLHFLDHDQLYLVTPRSRLMDSLQATLLRLEGNWLSRGRFRMILAGGGIGLGIMQLMGIVNVVLALGTSVRLEQLMSGWILHSMVTSKSALGWFLIRLGLESVVGFVLVLAAVLLILRKDHRAIALTILGLLLSLAGVNLLKFYFEQFSTIFSAAVQFSFLLAALRYRRKYLAPSSPGPHPGVKPSR